MPFDHARCPSPSCRAMLDPERLKPGPNGPLCYYCGTPLSMEDIFGVTAAFAEEEEEQMSIDDLVPGMGSQKPRSAPANEAKKPLTLENLLPGPTNPKRR